MSSPSLTLLSSVMPLRADFESFVLILSGCVSHQDDTLNGAIDAEGKWTAEGNWIQFEQPSPYVESLEIGLVMEEFGDEITRKLGGRPRTFISVITYRPKDWRDWPKVRTVTAEVIVRFMQRWPSVCLDEKELLYDLAEYAARAAHLTENGSV